MNIWAIYSVWNAFHTHATLLWEQAITTMKCTTMFVALWLGKPLNLNYEEHERKSKKQTTYRCIFTPSVCFLRAFWVPESRDQAVSFPLRTSQALRRTSNVASSSMAKWCVVGTARNGWWCQRPASGPTIEVLLGPLGLTSPALPCLPHRVRECTTAVASSSFCHQRELLAFARDFPTSIASELLSAYFVTKLILHTSERHDRRKLALFKQSDARMLVVAVELPAILAAFFLTFVYILTLLEVCDRWKVFGRPLKISLWKLKLENFLDFNCAAADQIGVIILITVNLWELSLKSLWITGVVNTS